MKRSGMSARTSKRGKAFINLASISFLLIFMSVMAGPSPAGESKKFCSATARAALRACRFEARDDFWTATGICLNLTGDVDREECMEEAGEELSDARDLCAEQFEARLDLCVALGEAPYDPEFDPGDFTNLFDSQNPYFPLSAGNRWIYENPTDDEIISVEVLDKTKLIGGVTCIVVRDLVEEGGEVIEDTDDWYGQALSGDVHYCGEIARNFETFAGDDPEEPELVEIEGSWKAGRDDDKPGIIMFSGPQVGVVYRQEFSLGNAEDAAEVLSNSYGYGTDPDLDLFVPRALAELLCNDDCVVTRDFTPIEPDAAERKYYAPGIGLFLEVDTETGHITRLVDCNMNPSCASLP